MQSLRSYHYLFALSLGWTLVLLLLGSVVHATESSLACPDWPTCFGTMMPEMKGGVFYEHLHRLWAGGLMLLWTAGTILAFRSGASGWVRKAAVAGLVLLLVQSVFGGLTVIFRLPDAISTTHLGLALVFLSLATWISARGPDGVGWDMPRRLRGPNLAAAGLVFIQSLVGAAVRHTDSGLACPDVPRCVGEWVPPLEQWPIALHFSHRLLALITSVVVVAVGLWSLGVIRTHPRTVRSGASLAAGRLLAASSIGLVIMQVTLGILSVTTFLAVAPVSLHTLVAALLLASLVGLAALPGGPEVAAQRALVERQTAASVG